MKRWVVYLTILGALALLALPVQAARTPKVTTSSIALAGSGEARSTQPALGGTVEFSTTVESLAGWEYPMVAVWCYQDLNGDGIKYFPNDGGDLVYMWLDSPDASFPLGAASSKWVDLGGAADCQAILYAYGSKGNRQTVRELAQTAFSASA